MIEINAAAGENRKDGTAAPRPQNPTAFRSFLESLGGAAKPASATPTPLETGARADREPAQRASERGVKAASMGKEPAEHDARALRGSNADAKPVDKAMPSARKVADRSASSRPAPGSRTDETPVQDVQETEPAGKPAAREGAATEAVETASEAIEVAEDKPAEPWQDIVSKTLALLGIVVDPTKLNGLTGQELRELDVALRAGLKGLTEGQPIGQVAKVVGELLPVPLQSVLPDAFPVPGTASLPESAKDAASVPGPVREHKTLEIGRLAEKMTELVRPMIATTQGEATTPLAASGKEKGESAPALTPAGAALPSAEELPVLPVAGAKEAAQAESATVPDLPKLAEAAKPRKEDPSAFLRLDPAGFQIQRTDLQESAKAEAKAPVFRPSGPAGEMLAHQVYDEFQLRPGMDHREMVLKLWPRELGQVSVHIKMAENERVEAKILVQNENIRQALIEHTPVLRETLAKQGLELGSLSVSVGGEGQSFGNQSGREGSSRRRGGHAWEDGVLETSVRVDAGTDTGRRNGFNSIDMLT